MPLNFKIEGDDGKEMDMAADKVVNDYMQAGYQNVSLSQDGTTLTATDPQTGEPMDADLHALVNSQYGKVKSAVPQNVDYGGVNKWWRAQLEGLPNDTEMRKVFLKGELEKLGIKDRKIIGEGEDFYSFNPETGKYSALTNAPGMDLSDVAGFGPSAIRAGGALLGGALGGIGAGAAGTAVAPGVGTVGLGIAGTALGSGIGGGLADEGMRKVAGWLNPNFKNTMDNMTEEQQSGNRSEQMGRAALDAGTGGIARVPGVAKVLNKINPLSYFAQGTGKAADVVGRTAAGAGKFIAENDLARSVATSLSPLSPVQSAGLVMRAGELPGLANKGVQKLANKFAPSGRVAEATADIMKPRAVPYTQTDKVVHAAKKAMAAGAEEAQTAIVPVQAGVKDTIKNMATKAGSALDQHMFDKSGNVTGYQDILENIGGKVGGGLQNMSKLGRGIENSVDNIMKYTAKGVQKTGQGLAKTGRGLNTAGRILEPFESRVILNRGVPALAEEAQDAVPKVKRYFKPTQYQY